MKNRSIAHENIFWTDPSSDYSAKKLDIYKGFNHYEGTKAKVSNSSSCINKYSITKIEFTDIGETTDSQTIMIHK